jgi:hypothetical protein
LTLPVESPRYRSADGANRRGHQATDRAAGAPRKALRIFVVALFEVVMVGRDMRAVPGLRLRPRGLSMSTG